QVSYRTVLVLSGHTTRASIKQFAYKPDLICDCVADIPEEFYLGEHQVTSDELTTGRVEEAVS
ncbi:MAG: hypothetical protein R6U56_09650, partial [Opitutales bacterium]